MQQCNNRQQFFIYSLIHLMMAILAETCSVK
jgi:hypothetical protein